MMVIIKNKKQSINLSFSTTNCLAFIIFIRFKTVVHLAVNCQLFYNQDITKFFFHNRRELSQCESFFDIFTRCSTLNVDITNKITLKFPLTL